MYMEKSIACWGQQVASSSLIWERGGLARVYFGTSLRSWALPYVVAAARMAAPRFLSPSGTFEAGSHTVPYGKYTSGRGTAGVSW